MISCCGMVVEQLRVIFDRRDEPTTMVGLPSAAERFDLFGQFGNAPFDSFPVCGAPATEEPGQLQPKPPRQSRFHSDHRRRESAIF
jgi:hypothetical protein